MRRANRILILSSFWLLAALAATVFSSQPAFAQPSKPFNQCPKIGASASCAVLYVFNADGTISVYTDTSVGPYDSDEDTLVGVLNNSGKTQTSLTLSGVGKQGLGIFDFDGDGICTSTFLPFAPPPGRPQSEGSSYCSGTYYRSDPGDYAGPLTTFSNISTKAVKNDTGTINFTGGLAAGASTYFSLEDQLNSSTAPPPPPVTGGGSAVTLVDGPVLTTSGVGQNGCVTTHPASATFFTSDPVVTVWFTLGGLSPQTIVLSRFSFNGNLQASLDDGPHSQFMPGFNYSFCPSFIPNANAAGPWTLTIYVDGQVFRTIPFTISSGSAGGNPCAPTAANLIGNGSFELPGNAGSFIQLFANSATATAIPCWTVTTGSIDYVGTYWRASNGNYSLDMGGPTGPGAIAQSFSTSGGTSYTVSFDMAGTPASAPQPKVLQASAAGVSQSFSFDSSNTSVSQMGWLTKSFTFCATSSSTTLAFASLVSGDDGPALDNVRVVAGGPCSGGGGLSFTGTYICTFGASSTGTVTLTQTGTSLTGTLPNGGSLTGTVTITIVITFTGTWTSNSGTGTITFSTPDGNTLTGTWTRTTGTGDPAGAPATSTTGTVTGTKSTGGGTATCPASAFTGNNVIGNGGFELPGGATAFNQTGSFLPCWTITLGNIDYVGPDRKDLWLPSEGSYSLDMDGNTPGGIAQTFTAQAGQQYTVAFDLAGDYIAGANLKKLHVTVQDASLGGGQSYYDNTFSFDTSISGPNGGRTNAANMGWQCKSFNFTPNFSRISLSLYSASSDPTSNWGPALDNVRVFPTVPGSNPCAGSGGGGGTGTITGITLEGGSYSNSFSSNGNVWDTAPTSNWVLGVSAPGNANNPLLNAPNKSVNLQPGSYYTYNKPTGSDLGTAVRFTINWSDKTTDVAVFSVGSLTTATPLTRLSGSTNVSLSSTGVTTAKRVGGGLTSDGSTNDVLLLGILGTGTGGGTGGGGGGTCGSPVTNNLVLCLDATNGLAANGSTWKDLSGQGHDATALAGQAPGLGTMNGKTAAQFGGDRVMSIAGQVLTSQNYSVIAVVTDATTTSSSNTSFREIFSDWTLTNADQYVFLGDTGVNPDRVRFTDNIGGGFQGQGGQGTLVNPTSPFILSGIAGSNAAIYQNSNLLYQLGSAIPTKILNTPYYIGRQGAGSGAAAGGEYWNGLIAEVLVYNSALSTSDFNSVITYLTNKWLGGSGGGGGGGGTGGGGGGATPPIFNPSCSYGVSGLSQSPFPDTGVNPAILGGLVTADKTPASNCFWATYSPDTWIHANPTPAAPTIGSGSWSFTIDPNKGPQRQTTLQVADKSVTIVQLAGVAGCTYALSATSNSPPIPATGGSGNLIVTVGGKGVCSFSVPSTADVQVTSANAVSGLGDKTVSYYVGSNPTTNQRNLPLTITGTNPTKTLTYTVNQAAGTANNPNGPVISQGGVVNAASFIPASLPGGEIAQGSFFSIFGTNLGPPNPGVTASSYPLGNSLANVSVAVSQGGVSYPAIPQFVAQFQVNAIMPSNAPIGTVQVTVTYNGLVSNSVTITVVAHSIGIFAVAGGKGPGIIQNFVSGQVPLNTTSTTAAPGQTAIMLGTGLGALPAGTLDNQAITTALPISPTAQVFVGGVSAEVVYSGRAPFFAGIDQINFVVPPNAPQGCYVPVQAAVAGIYGNSVTIAIGPPGKPCADDNPFSSFSTNGGKIGTIVLSKFTLSDSTGLFGNGSIEAGLGLFEQLPANGPLGFSLFTSLPPLNSCAPYADLSSLSNLLGGKLPSGTGRVDLDAGASIAVKGPNGNQTMSYQDSAVKTSPYFSAFAATGALAGFVPAPATPYFVPGTYTVSGTGGKDVGAFSTNLNVATPATWTNRDQISTVNTSQNLSINWSGGSASTQRALIIALSYDSNQSGNSAMVVCQAPIGPAGFTVPSGVLAKLGTKQGGSPKTGVLVFATVPTPDQFVSFTAPSLDTGLGFYLVGDVRLVNFQ